MFLAKPFVAIAILASGMFPGASGVQDATYSLKHLPKTGEQSVYDIKVSYVADQVNFETNMKLQLKITKVEEDGAYEQEETLLEGVVKINGEEDAMEATEAELKKYDKDGKAIKAEGEEEEEEGADPFTASAGLMDWEPKAPVKVGDSWDFEDKIWKSAYKLIGEEKVGEVACWKIEVKGKIILEGSAGEGSGTAWIRKADFSTEKFDGVIESAKFDPEAPVGKVTLNLSRKS